MKLAKLIIDNFKGIRHFVLDAGGKSVTILGANGAGKSTVADAYFWLLFGKNAAGESDFTIKTIGSSGLDYAVEAVLIDERMPYDNEITFRRVLKEQWTKKRGEGERTLTGNTTEYYIDGVPKKQSEYAQFVSDLCLGDAVRLLTDPYYFTRLKWQEQLNILTKTFGGEVNDREVIDAYRSEIGKLHELIGMKTVSDYQLITKAQRKKINDRLHDIPVAIAAKQGAMPKDIPENTASLFPRREKLRLQRQEIERRISALQNGGEIASLETALQSAKANMEKSRADYYAAQSVDNEKMKEVQRVQVEHNHVASELNQIQREMQNCKLELESKSKQLDKLRAEYDAAALEHYTGNSHCPTCGQPLPLEKIELARGNWNQNHAKSLELIAIEGKICAARVKELESLLCRMEEQERLISDTLAASNRQLEELSQAIRKPDAFELTAIFANCNSEIDKIRSEILLAQSNSSALVEDERKKLPEVDSNLAEIERILAAAEQAAEITKQIDLLKSEEKELGAQLSELDSGLLLTEKFILRRAEYIQQRVNAAFGIVQWKLYDTQINGAINPTCVAMVSGVPYNDGLNSASKLNAGLDIINAFSGVYGIQLPILIDNSEGVTDIKAPSNTQIICLQVSAPDKVLRVEMRE